jgi:nuclease HARBI1
LKIRNIVARWPGSVHDQTMFNSSVLKRNFENGQYGKYRLIGDSGYALTHYLFTPSLRVNNEADRLYNESLIRTRNTVERQYGVWKRRFPILSVGIKVNIDTAMTIIVATAVLHNFAIMMNETPFENDENELFEANDNEIFQENDNRNIPNGRAQEARSVFIEEHFNY